jgi:predicted N-acetyltransferase YhbS
MPANLTIRPITSAELSFAAACTAGEGWLSENFTVIEGFFVHDPAGCFLAESAAGPVGICVATSYRSSGFIGELIVRPEARGAGIGAALLDQAIAYLQERGARTIYLDGVPRAVPLYERHGFRRLCRSLRFTGQLPGRSAPGVRLMQLADLPAVNRLDRQAFGADRSYFLARRLEFFPNLSKVLVQDGEVVGYIQGRRGETWAAAGPMVVASGVSQPERLLESFALALEGLPFGLGMLACNSRALGLIGAYHFTERPDSPWRMALGPDDSLGASPNCLAVGSAAKG